ncbi:MAG: hypothetical protein GX556_16755 [Fibrobacter sp.]|nr:hypothetical protein [Fibrobacter sp.]
MKFKRATIAITGIIFAAGIFTASTITDQNHLIHEVKKGESLSLICIDYYGYYSSELGAAIKKMNPEIKDVNLILTGWKLKFKKPDSPDSVKSAAKKEVKDTLFTRKAAITQGVATCIEGNVTVKRAGKDSFTKLTVNSILNPGDIIRTAAAARAEIIINRESVVRLNEKTEMTLEALRDPTKAKNSKTRIGFPAGSIWTKMKKFRDKISRFELELPTAIAAVHGTVYETSVNPDSSSEVKVFSGEVAVRNAPAGRPSQVAGVQEIAGPDEVSGPQEVSFESWTQIVRSMQMIKVDNKGVPSKPVSFSDDSASDWENWNKERDKRIAEIFSESPNE